MKRITVFLMVLALLIQLVGCSVKVLEPLVEGQALTDWKPEPNESMEAETVGEGTYATDSTEPTEPSEEPTDPTEPADPVPADPAPTVTEPVEPQPTADPQPTESHPTAPVPSATDPAESETTGPAPTEPAPTEPAAAAPEATNPETETTAPDVPDCESVPVETEPTESKPVEHTHSHTVSEVISPTCEDGGYSVYSCSCGDTYKGNETAAVGHCYTEKVTAATCTSGGYTSYTCSACGDSYTGNKTAAAGHSYTQKVTAPTCTEGGYTAYACSACGDGYTADEVQATGHSWGEWYESKAATVLEEGVESRCCVTCEKVEQRATNMLTGNSIKLKIPQNTGAVAVMAYPSEEDFGVYYDHAVAVYEAILNGAEEISLSFAIEGTSESYNKADPDVSEKVREIMEGFANTFEQKVLRGVCEFRAGRMTYYSGEMVVRVRVMREKIEKYIADQEAFYRANLSAGLYDGMSEKAAVAAINQWLCENVTFEVGTYKPIDVLEKRVAQCAGYATLFCKMCENAGIECEYVVGCIDSENIEESDCPSCHAWNRVKIGDSWFYIDVCWNDSPRANRYFLSEELWENRSISSSEKYE